MKLVKRKTRKAIEKAVRKAMKKHGPALMASLASGVASSIAALATTKEPGKRGKSNLSGIVERAEESLMGKTGKKSRTRKSEKKRRSPEETEPDGAKD